GAASEEAYPTEATTETRRAARSGSSEAALIPTGKASAAPRPHRAMTIVASHSHGLKPNSRSHTSHSAADRRNTDTRVCPSTSPGDAARGPQRIIESRPCPSREGARPTQTPPGDADRCEPQPRA